MAAAKRTGVYLSESTLNIIGPANSLSGRLNTICHNYDRITRAELPALTLNEWSLLCDILNATVVEDNTGDHLWADIAESGRLDGMAEKWELDTEEFAARVRDMSIASRCAILDVVLRFWKGRDEHSEGMEKMLLEAGAKIK